MRIEQEQSNRKSPGVGQAPFAVCPDCGGGMARSEQVPSRMTCQACGETQQIEELRPESAQRQESHFHDRGINRLRAAFIGRKDLP